MLTVTENWGHIWFQTKLIMACVCLVRSLWKSFTSKQVPRFRDVCDLEICQCVFFDRMISSEHPFASGTFHYSTSCAVYLNESLRHVQCLRVCQLPFKIWILGLLFVFLGTLWYKTPHVLRVAPIDQTVHYFCLHAGCFCPTPTWEGLVDAYSLDFCNQLDQLLWFS